MRKESKLGRQREHDDEIPSPEEQLSEESADTPEPEPQADGSPKQGESGQPSQGRSSAESEMDVERLGRDLEEQRDRYLRLAADYDNYRKRTSRERLDSGTRAQAELVKQLLDALDDLGRVTALDPAATDAATVIDGVELVERKLFKALTAAGLEIINPVDEPFNPEIHEAVGTAPALSREDDSMVAMVYQQGYAFKGQLIRPARVVVKQWNG